MATEVLRDLSFSASTREVIVIRGPNGCGKTTLLNILAGVDQPTTGVIRRSSTAKSIGYVFQNYSSSLLPWLTLRENMLLPLRFQGLSTVERTRYFATLNGQFTTEDVPLDRYPAEASGGQKQRACIGRAVLCRSPIVLMDEPFSSLDENGHKDLANLVEILRTDEHRLVVMVLHDLDDAIFLADRVLSLRGQPSQIIDECRIDLPRPRTPERRLTAQFAELRARIIERSYGHTQV